MSHDRQARTPPAPEGPIPEARPDFDRRFAGPYGAQDLEAAMDAADAEPSPDSGPWLDQAAPLVGTFLDETIATMRRRARGEERPISLPWPSVAETLKGGLWPGLHILVGNTGSGKSQFALQLALKAARSQTPVLYIGLELGKTDLVARLLGLMSGRRWSHLWLGDEPNAEQELDRIYAEHQSELRALPFRLEFAPPMGWDYTRIERATEQMLSIHGTTHRPLIVLDYLQLVQPPTAPGMMQGDLRERIGRAAYVGRAAARMYEAAVLIVSSTARDKYAVLNGHPDKNRDAKVGERTWEKWAETPFMLVGSGKESGEVEFAADSVLVLVRGERLKFNRLDSMTAILKESSATETHLAIAKSRAGVTGWRALWFDGGRFWEPSLAELETSERRTRSPYVESSEPASLDAELELQNAPSSRFSTRR